MKDWLAAKCLKASSTLASFAFKLTGGVIPAPTPRAGETPLGGRSGPSVEVVGYAGLSSEARSMRADLKPVPKAVESEGPEPLAGGIEERLAKSRPDW